MTESLSEVKQKSPLTLAQRSRILAALDLLRDLGRKRRDRQAQANEITKAIIWSMREMGRIIQDMQARGELATQDSGINQHRVSNRSTPYVSLSDLGVTRDESSWAQTLYEAPEKVIEDYFAKCEDSDKQITIKGALDLLRDLGRKRRAGREQLSLLLDGGAR